MIVAALRTVALLSVILAGSVSTAHAQSPLDEDLAAEFLFGDTRTALGYSMYRTSFFDLGYTFGFMPFLSDDGRGRVLVSGITYDENKGPLINLVTLILMWMGVSDTRYVGSDAIYDYYVYDPAGAARQRAALRDTFSHLPLSMGARVYSSVLGSQADGFTLEASFRDPIGDHPPAVVWGIGAHIGWFASNTQWAGPVFQSVWGGANADLRISIFEYLGIWLRVGVWFGGAHGVAVPIELGPEIMIGNRFYLRGLASIDPVRPEALPDGIGMRIEAGLRL